MKHLMLRIEMDDYDQWLATHYDHVEDRKAYGMDDGPVYRDIDDPNAALFHIRTQDVERAMEWFRSDTFQAASRRATVRGRELYLAEAGLPARAPTPAG